MDPQSYEKLVFEKVQEYLEVVNRQDTTKDVMDVWLTSAYPETRIEVKIRYSRTGNIRVLRFKVWSPEAGNAGGVPEFPDQVATMLMTRVIEA